MFRFTSHITQQCWERCLTYQLCTPLSHLYFSVQDIFTNWPIVELKNLSQIACKFPPSIYHFYFHMTKRDIWCKEFFASLAKWWKTMKKRKIASRIAGDVNGLTTKRRNLRWRCVYFWQYLLSVNFHNNMKFELFQPLKCRWDDVGSLCLLRRGGGGVKFCLFFT